MAAILLEGKKIAQKHLEDFQKKVQTLALSGQALKLATLQAGTSKDIELYSNYLTGLLQKIGIQHEARRLPESCKEKEMIQVIQELNRDESVTGVMIFSPLPKHLNPMNVFDVLSAKKDVEGRTFLKSHFGVFSPTANAVMSLIDSTSQNLEGKEAVVIGHSDLVGKPVAVLLMDRHATVTVCHIKTTDMKHHIERADILVAAVGKAHVIGSDYIKTGAIVIDVGENFVNGSIVGDIEFEGAKKKAGFITPVPGGVGPLTNVMLVQNLIRLHELKGKMNGNN